MLNANQAKTYKGKYKVLKGGEKKTKKKKTIPTR